jgi:dihydroorotase
MTSISTCSLRLRISRRPDGYLGAGAGDPAAGTRNLDVGSEADVAVFRMETGRYGLLDSAGARMPGTRRIACELTLRKGALAWDRNGLSSEDWKTFQYRNGPFFEK